MPNTNPSGTGTDQSGNENTTDDSGGSGGSTGVPAGTAWSFLTALVVITALVILTIFLANHYPKAAGAATILGIVVPVFAGAFGASLGYWTGNATGASQGQAQGKQQAKAQVQPKLEAAEQAVTNIVDKIREEGRSDPGAAAIHFDQSLPQTVTFGNAELTQARDSVTEARSAVESL
jgi:hypothetical protein